MSAFDISISTKFFGLNKPDVKEYLSSLQKEHEKALKEFSDQVKRLEKEKEKLLAELAEAKKETIEYQDEIIEDENNKSDVISDAYKRIDKTVALINMLADEETAQYAKKASEQLAEYDGIIDDLQQVINENRAKIDSMLADVLKLLKSNIDDVLDKDDNKEEEKRIVRKPLASEKNDISSFVRKLIEEEVPVEKEKRERVTADGTSLKDIQKLLDFKKKYAPPKNDTYDDLADNAVKKKDNKDALHHILNGYDIDDEFNFNAFGISDFDDDELNSDYDDDELTDDSSPNKNNDNSSENNPKSETEIKKMRNDLIIGKIAGEALLDSENNIIIAKGKTLTEEDIHLAEKEMKLPELIINMMLAK